MNKFASTQSDQGLLKDYSDDTADALARRRKKLAETKLGLEPDAEDEDTDG